MYNLAQHLDWHEGGKLTKVDGFCLFMGVPQSLAPDSDIHVPPPQPVRVEVVQKYELLQL